MHRCQSSSQQGCFINYQLKTIAYDWPDNCISLFAYHQVFALSGHLPSLASIVKAGYGVDKPTIANFGLSTG
jgi:hypothetical protein